MDTETKPGRVMACNATQAINDILLATAHQLWSVQVLQMYNDFCEQAADKKKSFPQGRRTILRSEGLAIST